MLSVRSDYRKSEIESMTLLDHGISPAVSACFGGGAKAAARGVAVD
jgi:hypothetical protein